jgi:hypothetical protein
MAPKRGLAQKQRTLTPTVMTVHRGALGALAESAGPWRGLDNRRRFSCRHGGCHGDWGGGVLTGGWIARARR